MSFVLGVVLYVALVGALDARYDVVLANIESKTLVELAPALAARVASGGLLVLSGILAADVAPAQLEEVRSAYRDLGEERIVQKGEWVAVVLRNAP